MPVARLEDVELYYEEHGTGEPLLLVPPSWWPCDTWNIGVVPALSDRYKVVLSDCRGAGRSSRPAEGYNVAQFADDALRLLRHREISRSHVVGFALGGEIAQAMALRSPQVVATLTMAATGPGNKSLSGGPRGTSHDAEQIREKGFERFIRSHVENDTNAFSEGFYRDHRDVVRALAQALWERQAEPEYYLHHHDARRSWDTLANAALIKVPTLIMVGSDDNVNRGNSTPLATAQRLAELVPGAQLALLPGVKHMTLWDGTAGVSTLRDFLARHPI
jgi:pimeloyl-ACP methyl ester carboxylesterase